MKKILIALAVFFILLAGTGRAQDQVAKPTEEKLKIIIADFDRYAAKSIAEWKIPGMAVGIVRDGKTIFTKGYGVKTLGGHDPVTEKTIFQIGSTTKAFTATLTAMLVDEGKIKWGDQVIRHLPDFMMFDPWVTREFQVVDLLSQHSGLPANAADTLFLLGFDRPYIRQALRNIKPVSSFRAQYAYQNGLWLVASQLIEKYTGKTYEQALKERIFDPLGMSHSSADRDSFLAAGDVSGLHAAEGDKIRFLPNWEFLDWSYVAGPAGAINSNVLDMAKWLAFQMDNGKVKDKQLVSETNMQVIHSPKTMMTLGGPAHKNVFYCLGWLYHEHSPYPIIWHNGGTLMKTMVAYIPEEQIGVVILSNHITELPEMLAFRFFDQYEGKPDKDYSAEALAAQEKAKKAEKAKKPVAPQNPIPAMPLDRYAGDYFSAVYGKATISVDNGRLFLVLGPKKVKVSLSHWDKDTFVVHFPVYGFDQEFGFAAFQVDPQSQVKGVTLDELNQDDDLGVFKRVEGTKAAR